MEARLWLLGCFQDFGVLEARSCLFALGTGEVLRKRHLEAALGAARERRRTLGSARRRWTGGLCSAPLCVGALANRGSCCEAHLLAGTEDRGGGARKEGSGWTPPAPPPAAQINHLPVCLFPIYSDHSDQIFC